MNCILAHFGLCKISWWNMQKKSCQTEEHKKIRFKVNINFSFTNLLIRAPESMHVFCIALIWLKVFVALGSFSLIYNHPQEILVSETMYSQEKFAKIHKGKKAWQKMKYQPQNKMLTAIKLSPFASELYIILSGIYNCCISKFVKRESNRHGF